MGEAGDRRVSHAPPKLRCVVFATKRETREWVTLCQSSTYLYTSGKHKKETNKVQKRKENIVQERKGINQRISSYSQQVLERERAHCLLYIQNYTKQLLLVKFI